MEVDYWKTLSSLNAESFRQLMLLYGQDVWNYAYFLTKRPDMADDISQDVFLKAYGSIASFRGESSVRTWLLTITRNTAVNYQRSAFIRKVLLVDWVVRRDTHPSAEHEALERCYSNEVWEIVMKLPDKYREVLVLDAKYELTAKEMAALLQISEGTVKSRLSRARSKVTAVWKEAQAYERA